MVASFPPSPRDGCANSMFFPSRRSPRAKSKLLMYVAAVLRLYDSMMFEVGRRDAQWCWWNFHLMFTNTRSCLPKSSRMHVLSTPLQLTLTVHRGQANAHRSHTCTTPFWGHSRGWAAASTVIVILPSGLGLGPGSFHTTYRNVHRPRSPLYSHVSVTLLNSFSLYVWISYVPQGPSYILQYASTLTITRVNSSCRPEAANEAPRGATIMIAAEYCVRIYARLEFRHLAGS